jgi:recombination protein RecT
MPLERIEEIKNRSESVKNGKGSPWQTDPNEMIRKTILNWAFKFLPKTSISEDMIRVIEADNEIEREDFEDWKKAQEIKQADSFKDDGKFTEFEEVSAN